MRPASSIAQALWPNLVRPARGALVAALLLCGGTSKAEYRAYKIAIRDEESGNERVVISTLDPIQYSGYYYLRKNESTRLVSSWKCWERSEGFKPICEEPPPREPAAAAPVASPVAPANAAQPLVKPPPTGL